MTDKKGNFCCDCEYAKKTGFIFKTWRCTNEEVNKAHLTGGNFEYDTCPVTAKQINKRGSNKLVDCRVARNRSHIDNILDENFCNMLYWDKNWNRCSYYKGNYRGHSFAPIKNRLPIPPKETPCHKAPKASQGRSQVASASD